MSARPTIAIPLPTSNDPAYNRANWQAYADAVLAAGGDPLQLQLGITPDARVMQKTSGIVLPGSPADVCPSRYGQQRGPATAAADHAREALDISLLEHAQRTGKPLLGICFGMQMLNVFYGGTLVQDLLVIPVNHAAGPSIAVAHSVELLGDSRLSALVPTDELQPGGRNARFAVNSSHHQAVGIRGEELAVSARCPQDAVVEALEHASCRRDGGRFLLGVQWHPERSTALSATSVALFDELLIEAKRHLAAERTGSIRRSGQ